MLSNWPIRYKMSLKLALLVLIVTALTIVSMVGLYSYRSLAKSVSARATELPLATKLGQKVSDLRRDLVEVKNSQAFQTINVGMTPIDVPMLRIEFGMHLEQFEQTLANYRKQLESNQSLGGEGIGDSHREQTVTRKIDEVLVSVVDVTSDWDWVSDDVQVDQVSAKVEELHKLTAVLPSYLHKRMKSFAGEVRNKYRFLIFITWGTAAVAAVMAGVFVRLFYRWIFCPLHVLIDGSRRVAGGDFDHRIQLSTEDEMSVLANAMNEMTDRFQAICDDLDRQVQDRTKQVVRSEQLASVGFLAAGVAHEINNPLASIAMCAESLESRLDEGAVPDEETAEGARRYLQVIQKESFRCKDITEKLLDFSRMGDVEHHNTDLRELIQDVIEMVSHLGNYKDRNLQMAKTKAVIAPVNPQELKQVVLNLITNALDSTDPGGTVEIDLGIHDGLAKIVVKDDGCGMTEEVRQHLFEPFFTRRRSGQGTGLGLSIVFRIVADHDGHIEAESAGPGKGSQVRVTLPLAGAPKENENRYQAA